MSKAKYKKSQKDSSSEKDTSSVTDTSSQQDNSFDSLSQTDGSLASTNKPTVPSLYDVLSKHNRSVYGHSDLASYKKYLSTLMLGHLQNHAVEVGVVPFDDRERLVNKLISEFSYYISKNQRMAERMVQDKSLSVNVSGGIEQGELSKEQKEKIESILEKRRFGH